MKSTIVIPVYNRQEYFQACLRSIKYQTVKPEVVVVDDTTDDFDVISTSRSIIPDCHILTIPPPKVYRRAQALNAGAAIATGEIVHLFDQDNVIAPDYIENTTKFHENWINLVVFPKTYYLPDIGFVLSHDIILRRMTSTPDKIIDNSDGNWSITSITRDNYFKIGGHNSTYTGWGGEDTEFCEFCIASGLVPILIEDIVFHLPHEPGKYGDAVSNRTDRVRNAKRLYDGYAIRRGSRQVS